MRYVSSSEAIWHFCGFLEHEQHSAEHVLCVHHESDHQVLVNQDDPIQAQQAAAAANRITDTMSYLYNVLKTPARLSTITTSRISNTTPSLAPREDPGGDVTGSSTVMVDGYTEINHLPNALHVYRK